MNKDDESTGVRIGKRIKFKNQCYFKQDVVNMIVQNQHPPKRHSKEHRKPSKAAEDNVVVTIFEYILTQYNLKQGLKMYEKQEEQATEKELAQIHNMNALQSLDATKLRGRKKKSNRREMEQ